MIELKTVVNIPLQAVFKDNNFNSWLAKNTDEVKDALGIEDWELTAVNKNETVLRFTESQTSEKYFIYCNMGEFQEQNLLNIMALAQVYQVSRVIWILENPQDKTIAALMNINSLAKKKYLTLMTAQAFKIGDSKPAIEFREH